MTSKLMISELEIFLKNNQPVSTQQLLEFYQTFEPDIKVNTLRWRIYQLKQNNVLYSPSRGQFVLPEKQAFQPEQTKRMTELAEMIQEKYPYANFSVYPTEWLNDLADHIYLSKNVILEVDIDALKSVFHFLKQQYRNVYLNPDEKFYDLYISPQEENIILKRLYVDAPLNRINENYHIPKLEQLLVDIIINDPMILPIGASEVKKIITNAQDKYNLNYSTILRYAKKRHVEKKLILFGLMEKEII
ncbi:DUF6577 family protein [Trichococcus shcherbakoviae]|uniref:DUF6577 family protein n=1 Tax=Trichococcus shcherbakoviae TaxID=2094020 RepID=UPI0029F4A2AE|nr:DUF6577 family protein [Trichococcus shcherbakoviae]